ncbi:MAG: Crp/Fnr family transcriptional regulator [Phycisphaerae bacterium]|nr:Crp/Fnr family transcriptional regulator [Phycisphaerae bacterium]
MTETNADTREALRGVPMFAALDAAAVERIIRACRVRRCDAGQILFTDGGEAREFFVLLEGRVKVYKLSPGGEQQILHHYGPGRTFAEAAVLAGGTYPAYAEAVDGCRLLAVPARRIHDLVGESPDLALGMLAGMAAKLHEFATLIEALSLKDVPARLATELLDEADAAGGDDFRLAVSKSELAARIAAAPATLSRALGKLAHAGVIAVEGRHVRILDRAQLEQLAG